MESLLSFIPLPVGLMKLMITVMQLLPKPPFNKDNLQGLVASKYVDTTKEFQQMKHFIRWQYAALCLVGLLAIVLQGCHSNGGGSL